ASLSAAAAVLLGGVIWVTTDSGRLKIEGPVNDVKLVISKDGKEYEVVDMKSGTAVRRLASGKYQIYLKDDRADVRLDKSGFTITRWNETVVKVSLRPPPPPFAGDTREAKIEAAMKAAREWRKIVDAADYGRAWDQCSEMFRQGMAKQKFVAENERFPLLAGKLKSRRLESHVYATKLPGAPDGEYVLLTFRSRFAGQLSEIVEYVNPTLEE